jgi:ferredoxin-type protein NapH
MESKESKKTYAILRKVRSPIVALFGLVLPNSYFPVVASKEIYDGPLKQTCFPGLNCHACPTAVSACPIGILQHFSAIGKVPFALIGLLGAIGMVFGRSVCGWLCPFGWIQDQTYKIKSRKFRIHPALKYGKYVSLFVLAILLPYFFEAHWFSRICPWGTLSAGIPWVIWNPLNPVDALPVIETDMVGWLYVLKLAILAAFLVLFVVTSRPFCRTLCPLGAIYAHFNRISFMRLEVEGQCVDCNLCVEVCPTQIRVSDDPNSPDCIRCLNCTVCKNVHVRWGTPHEFSNSQHTPKTAKG